MPIRDLLAPGAVVVGMATAAAVGQNQLDISKGKAQIPVAPVASSASAAPAAAALDVPGGVSFSGRVGFGDPTKLPLNRTVGGGYVSDFVVTNPECSDQLVSFSVQLVDRNRERLEVKSDVTRVERNPDVTESEKEAPPKGQWRLKAGEADVFRLTIAGSTNGESASGWAGLVWSALASLPLNYGYWTGHLPSTGILLLTRHSPSAEMKTENNAARCVSGPPQISRAARPLVLEPPLPSGLDTGVLVGSLGLALVVTLICVALVMRSSTNLLDPMPPVPFDFKNSWGANLAVGGGLITGIMTTAILSSDRYSSSSASYAVLAALFAALVPLGAALYGLSRPASGAGTTQGDGFVVSFLGTNLIVLWGAFGQLLLIGMFFQELRLAGVLSSVSAGLLIVTTKIVMVSLAIYAVIGSLGTIAAAAPEAQPQLEVQPEPPPAGASKAAPLPPTPPQTTDRPALSKNYRPAAMI
jgi:hypothetical protein